MRRSLLGVAMVGALASGCVEAPSEEYSAKIVRSEKESRQRAWQTELRMKFGGDILDVCKREMDASKHTSMSPLISDDRELSREGLSIWRPWQNGVANGADCNGERERILLPNGKVQTQITFSLSQVDNGQRPLAYRKLEVTTVKQSDKNCGDQSAPDSQEIRVTTGSWGTDDVYVTLYQTGAKLSQGPDGLDCITDLKADRSRTPQETKSCAEIVKTIATQTDAVFRHGLDFDSRISRR